MVKRFAVLLAAAVMLFCASPALADAIDPELIAAAQADGELVVYGSCEEDDLQAACDRFEMLYDVRVTYQRLSSGVVQARIEKENGHPSADIWFGGTTDPYNICAGKGLLQPYEAVNASHLLNPAFRDSEGAWYGIYKGILGFTVNTEKLEALHLEIPQDWPDLLKKEYRGLIWLSNYNTSGTAQLVLNTVIQKYGHDEGIRYLVELDKNIQVYTKSGFGPAKNAGNGDCVIAVGFLHDGITQIVDNGYDNLSLVIPPAGPPSRSARPPSSRAPNTKTPPGCGSNTRSVPNAWSRPTNAAPISSWCSTMPNSRPRSPGSTSILII